MDNVKNHIKIRYLVYKNIDFIFKSKYVDAKNQTYAIIYVNTSLVNTKLNPIHITKVMNPSESFGKNLHRVLA